MKRVETGLRRFAATATIVTGGPSGIGLATAERLADEGSNLCLVAAPSDGEQLETPRASSSVAASGS